MLFKHIGFLKYLVISNFAKKVSGIQLPNEKDTKEVRLTSLFPLLINVLRSSVTSVILQASLVMVWSH